VDLLRHLRIFVVVADELNFGRAADRLGMAQPPLSRAVRRLEDELGAELFDRSRRQVQLTPAGSVLLDQARDLLAREERTRALVRRAHDGDLGTLRAGVPPDTSAAVLGALIAECRERALRIDLQELTTDEQLRLLASGGLDVGLVQQPADVGGLELGPEVRLDLGVVLPRTSPLARLPEVALADLAGQDLVLVPRTSAPGWYDTTLEICRAAGFVPRRVRQARNPEFLIGLVTAGHGVAFDQGPVARKEPRVVWRPLAGRPLAQRIRAAWPGQSPHRAAAEFAAVAADVLARDRTPALGAAAPAAGTPAGESPAGDGPRPWSVVFG
jgi:DNA-binding transcriptional LysR family regulator